MMGIQNHKNSFNNAAFWELIELLTDHFGMKFIEDDLEFKTENGYLIIKSKEVTK